MGVEVFEQDEKQLTIQSPTSPTSQGKYPINLCSRDEITEAEDLKYAVDLGRLKGGSFINFSPTLVITGVKKVIL